MMGEGEPIGNVVATALDMLRTEALARIGDEKCHFLDDELNGCIIWRVGGES
jgi:hypothetical protein